MTGLHTCGNLAVSMIKLYLRSGNCPASINVGCCYHHLDERFCENPFNSPGKCQHIYLCGVVASATLPTATLPTATLPTATLPAAWKEVKV